MSTGTDIFLQLSIFSNKRSFVRGLKRVLSRTAFDYSPTVPSPKGGAYGEGESTTSLCTECTEGIAQKYDPLTPGVDFPSVVTRHKGSVTSGYPTSTKEGDCKDVLTTASHAPSD